MPMINSEKVRSIQRTVTMKFDEEGEKIKIEDSKPVHLKNK